MASGDKELIAQIKNDVAIWNINSFAEYYMQIYEKYHAEYTLAKQRFWNVRKEYIKMLGQIQGLRVVPSQANYLMCEILHPCGAKTLTQDLLVKYNILIKDLSSKKGINGADYIRIAVRTEQENEKIVKALRELLG